VPEQHQFLARDSALAGFAPLVRFRVVTPSALFNVEKEDATTKNTKYTKGQKLAD
jgi:hypothetical protein